MTVDELLTALDGLDVETPIVVYDRGEPSDDGWLTPVDAILDDGRLVITVDLAP